MYSVTIKMIDGVEIFPTFYEAFKFMYEQIKKLVTAGEFASITTINATCWITSDAWFGPLY